MKLLLNSSWLTTPKLEKAFVTLISKPLKETKLLIIHQKEYIKNTFPEYNDYVETMIPRDTAILVKLGISTENITNYDVKTKKKPDLSNNDILYVQGGNNFYYLQQFKENSYMENIREFIESGKPYFGISAGSMIMSPTVDLNLTMDENLVGLKDLTGFGLVPFYIIPHWDSKDDELRKKMLNYAYEAGKQVYVLTDQQGILVINDEIRVIQ